MNIFFIKMPFLEWILNIKHNDLIEIFILNRKKVGILGFWNPILFLKWILNIKHDDFN